MQQLKAALEGCMVASTVQLGRDERNDHVAELVVQLPRLGRREVRCPQRALERLVEGGGVRAGERPREQGRRPWTREEVEGAPHPSRSEGARRTLNFRGKERGERLTATARVIDDPGIDSLLREKYGWQKRVLDRFNRGKPTQWATIELTDRAAR